MSVAPVYARSSVRAGALRHLVAVMAATESRTSYGGTARLWTTSNIRSAHVMPLSGGELDRARSVVATATHKVTMRHYSGLTPKMRLFHIECAGTQWSVTGATNATPIVATFVSASTLAAGNYVWIQSVGGNTATNGVWRVRTSTFAGGAAYSVTLEDDVGNSSAGNGAYSSAGTADLLYGRRVLNVLHIADLDSKRHTIEVLCGEEVL